MEGLYMKMMALLFLWLCANGAWASQGLTIHAAEIGVSKFHRLDNKIHPYAANNVWRVNIAPEGVLNTPIIQTHKDGSVQIIFSNLEELLNSIVKVSKLTGKKVSVFNLGGHGLPGGMWYPKDAATQASSECKDWNDSAQAQDQANYDQYYSAVSKNEIMQLRQFSHITSNILHPDCTTGLDEWKEAVAKVSDIQRVFEDDAQLHVDRKSTRLNSSHLVI